MASGGLCVVGNQVSAHGRIDTRPIDCPYGTHVLVGPAGEVLNALRSPAIRLDAYLGREATVSGNLVEAAPGGGWPALLDVASVAVRGVEPMRPVPIVMPVIVPKPSSPPPALPFPPPGWPAHAQPTGYSAPPVANRPPPLGQPPVSYRLPQTAYGPPPVGYRPSPAAHAARAPGYRPAPPPRKPRQRPALPAIAPSRAARGIRPPAALPDARPLGYGA